jgi:hypothetical protein
LRYQNIFEHGHFLFFVFKKIKKNSCVSLSYVLLFFSFFFSFTPTTLFYFSSSSINYPRYGQCMSAEARHKVRGTTQPVSTSSVQPPAEAKSSSVTRTGNAEVDEDIEAYEQAKQELYLLQRRQAQQR